MKLPIQSHISSFREKLEELDSNSDYLSFFPPNLASTTRIIAQMVASPIQNSQPPFSSMLEGLNNSSSNTRSLLQDYKKTTEYRILNSIFPNQSYLSSFSSMLEGLNNSSSNTRSLLQNYKEITGDRNLNSIFPNQSYQSSFRSMLENLNNNHNTLEFIAHYYKRRNVGYTTQPLAQEYGNIEDIFKGQKIIRFLTKSIDQYLEQHVGYINTENPTDFICNELNSNDNLTIKSFNNLIDRYAPNTDRRELLMPSEDTAPPKIISAAICAFMLLFFVQISPNKSDEHIESGLIEINNILNKKMDFTQTQEDDISYQLILFEEISMSGETKTRQNISTTLATMGITSNDQ